MPWLADSTAASDEDPDEPAEQTAAMAPEAEPTTAEAAPAAPSTLEQAETETVPHD